MDLMPLGYFRDKPDSMWWLAQIRSGIEFRKKLTHEIRWNDWRKFYRGEFTIGTLPVNVFFKLIRTMVPRIYFRNPQVSITPRKGQQGQINYAILAMLMQRMDNTLLDQMRFKQTNKKIVQDAIMFGTGIPALGYGGEFTPTPELVDTTEAPRDKRNYRLEYNSNVHPDMPWVLRIPPADFIVPPGAIDWPSSRWCAQRIRRHRDDLAEDERFRHARDIKPGSLLIPGSETISNKLEGMVELYLIRDKKSKRVFVICPASGEKVLYDEDDDLQYKGRLPYYPIQFNVDDEYFWAAPDSIHLEPHQRELNETRSLIRKHRRISIIKFLVRQGALSQDEISKLNSEEVGAVLNLDDEGQMADVKEMQAGDIPEGLLKMDSLENQQVQEIMGVGVNQFGEYAPGSADRSATEAQIVNQATQIRVDERRDVTADAVVDIIEHINGIILVKWDRTEVVNLLGETGADLWVEFKTQDLKGLDYDIRVDIDSAVPDTRDKRRADAIGLYKTFGQDQAVDHAQLVLHALREFGGPALEDLAAQGGTPQTGTGAAQPPGGVVPLRPDQPGGAQGNPMQLQQLISQVAGARR